MRMHIHLATVTSIWKMTNIKTNELKTNKEFDFFYVR